MSEQNTIPAEMLDAAARAIQDKIRSSGMSKVLAEAALRAAGVPALRERIAELEAALDLARMQAADNTALTEKAAKYAASKDARIAELEAELGEVNLIAEARSVVGMDLLAEVDQQEARIAELEVALDGRICEGCNKLVANVGQLHLCGCQEQRNLCGACKAECACAGGRE